MAFDESIDISKPFSYINFTEHFSAVMNKTFFSSYSDMVILCIGTDRSTGDCLGPLVGHKLRDIKMENVHIYGSLDEPVHAKNLSTYIRKLKSFEKPFVIAVDACLGKADRIGYINIKDSPLYPGAGLNKKLPSIGDISITGVVNVGGFMEVMVLQNTRLSLVMSMANIIAGGIRHNLWKNHMGNGLIFQSNVMEN